MNKAIKPSLLASAIAMALASGPVSAEIHDLCAVSGTKDLPDGSSVTVWGYSLNDPTDGCGAVQIPGPELAVTDGNLTINLTNNLPEPTSIVIPGQALPDTSINGALVSGPTWNDNTTGSRGGDLSKRVRSFGAETAPTETGTYTWTVVERSGTFMYHSGTHPQKQVYMGLYGAVTKDAVAVTPTTPAEVYAGVTYDNAVTLFYSDIDPVFNDAVATGTLTTAIERHPTWFLINGEPYAADMADIPAGVAGDRTLVRFLSAASEKHVPVLQGLYGEIHGEDGFQYNWQDGALEAGKAPRVQYSVGLPPLKTKDVIITPQADGRYAVYDGNGYMTNPSNPDDITQGDTVGGMLRFLQVGAAPNIPPVANEDAATVETNASVTIDVLANDTDADGDTLTITAVTNGTLDGATATTDGATVTYNAGAIIGTDSLTYDISDGNGGTSSSTVSVSVIATNTAPVAADDSYATDEDIILSVVAPGVLNNDTDAESDPLTAALVSAPANGALVLGSDGSFSYTPNADYNGTDSFTYTANDATGVSNTATVSITVNSVNDAPVIVSTPVTTVDEGVPLYTYDVDATDVDAGDTLTFSLDVMPVGMTIDPVSGLINWTPTAAGDYSVTVRVTDSAVPEASTTQAYTLTVVAANTAPEANDDSNYSTDEDTVLSIGAPGVLGNDTDDGLIAPLTAALDSPTTDGTLILNADGSFSYTPDVNFDGSDTFTYVANDGELDSNIATVSITVNPVNDAPVAVNLSATVTKGNGNSVIIDLLANASDIENDAISINGFSQPSGATVTDNGDGTVTLTLTNGNSVVRQFTYSLIDAQGAVSNLATVTVTVN